MLSSVCHNCGSSKTVDFYAENYCKTCMEAVNSAVSEAEKANTDPGIARRTALALRAHDSKSNRMNPKLPLHKSDYWIPEIQNG